jgi:monoamine oxidase
MGGVVKFILRFAEPFWEPAVDEAVSFMHGTAEDAVPTWWTSLPMRTNVLSGWAGGPAAQRLSGLPPRQQLARAVSMLSRLTGRSARRVRGLLIEARIHDWSADPFSRGAYSYGTVGGAGSAARLAQPIEQTLFFAGEATSSGMTGTVEAAITTGRRAARELLDSVESPELRRG